MARPGPPQQAVNPKTEPQPTLPSSAAWGAPKVGVCAVVLTTTSVDLWYEDAQRVSQQNKTFTALIRWPAAPPKKGGKKRRDNNIQVILHMLTDTRQINDRLNTEGLQFLLVANSTEH